MTMRLLQALVAALFLAVSMPSVAFEPIEFRSEAEEERYRGLLHQLRCVMCQNQSLADSPADIAGDLRMQVLELVREGRSDAEIRAFLVERYGEFILYSPPVSPATWLLWFGPALVLLAGTAMVVVTVRRKSAGATRKPVPPTDEDKQEW
jgi:cytochrome c-type biogenesis protein CcmH